MRKTRRAVVAVVLGLTAVASLAACRVEQGTAVIVGDARISEKQVNQYVSSLPVEAETPLGGFRTLTVDALAVIELGEQVADKTGKSPDPADGDTQRQFWTQQGLAKDHGFVDLMAKAESYRAMLVKDAEPAAPTDNDVNEVADQLGDNTGTTLTEAAKSGVRTELESPQGMEIIGQRHQLADYVDDYHVTVNPRYGDTFIIVTRGQQFEPQVTVPLKK